MVGFEIRLNGEYVTAAIERGVLTVILTHRNRQGEDEISLNVAGLDLDAGTDTTWLKEERIQEDDEIVIKIKKVEQATTPENKMDLDKELLQRDRVASYYELRSALEKEGLI